MDKSEREKRYKTEANVKKTFLKNIKTWMIPPYNESYAHDKWKESVS